MTEPSDVRWRQRLDNYLRAFKKLDEAVALGRARELSDLEQQGLVQAFEYTHELAWKLLKDYLQHKGFTDLIGSRDATRAAFQNELLSDGEAWMDMIKARNLTSHTYDEGVAHAICEDILHRFHPALAALAVRFVALRDRVPSGP